MYSRGILLCAGSSRRMGRPKALLEFSGETFLEHILGVLSRGGVDELVVVLGGPDDAQIESLIMSLEDLHTRVVHNPDPSRGQISSIQCGLAVEEEQRDVAAYLIHPVDIPGICADDVKALLEAAAAYPDASAVVLSVGGRRAHPLLMPRALADRARELPAPQTMRDLLAAPGVTVRHVNRKNELLLQDVDTPEDYENLRRRPAP